MNINIFNKIKNFDKVTKFRLQNSFIYAIGLNLIIPIMIDLKGEYLLPWIISMFLIFETLIVKTNKYIVEKFTMSQLYQIGIIVYSFVVFLACSYFYNPYIMIYGDSVIIILQVAIFSAYSIKLNNYLTKYYPDDMSNFQITRNSIWADGVLFGLITTTIVLYLFNRDIGIITFILFNSIYVIWMLLNWDFFKDIKE